MITRTHNIGFAYGVAHFSKIKYVLYQMSQVNETGIRKNFGKVAFKPFVCWFWFFPRLLAKKMCYGQKGRNGKKYRKIGIFMKRDPIAMEQLSPKW